MDTKQGLIYADEIPPASIDGVYDDVDAEDILVFNYIDL